MESMLPPRPASATDSASNPAQRKVWLWGFNLVLLIAAVMLWPQLHWRKISDTPDGIVWQRGRTTHTDRNRDGLIDEEIIRLPNGDLLIRRDSDLDGWFDLRYLERRGLPVNLETIREPAPRH
ncbi:MAG: hypothetical protein EB141_03445 [Verrucomicrobia bacterium]|nr:hypothetical protein [Verrucomicrobiota bacterium]NBU07738.1 hypothetical protein [Pseudomonadota bacterium]NDA66565.1 hypothetical protein [Verrucomicrobiota bacterium]NDB74693.1 hypothetical protein [Verrucomicrobiota bacterium]NDD38444.1 hypothetical protein [Verrucomicrobiota bacterium]